MMTLRIDYSLRKSKGFANTKLKTISTLPVNGKALFLGNYTYPHCNPRTCVTRRERETA